jgi:hypothetical protein
MNADSCSSHGMFGLHCRTKMTALQYELHARSMQSGGRDRSGWIGNWNMALAKKYETRRSHATLANCHNASLCRKMHTVPYIFNGVMLVRVAM